MLTLSFLQKVRGAFPSTAPVLIPEDDISRASLLGKFGDGCELLWKEWTAVNLKAARQRFEMSTLNHG